MFTERVWDSCVDPFRDLVPVAIGKATADERKMHRQLQPSGNDQYFLEGLADGRIVDVDLGWVGAIVELCDRIGDQQVVVDLVEESVSDPKAGDLMFPAVDGVATRPCLPDLLGHATAHSTLGVATVDDNASLYLQ